MSADIRMVAAFIDNASKAFSRMTGRMKKQGRDVENQWGITNKQLELFPEHMKKSITASQGLSRAMGGAVGTALRMSSVFVATKLAIDAWRIVVTGAIKESDEYSSSIKRLEFAGVRNIKQTLIWTEELQRLSGVSSNVIASNLAMARTMGANEKAAKAMVRGGLEFAIAKGVDFNDVMRNLINTLSGESGELGQQVPQIKELTKAMRQAGGAGQIMVDIFGGSLAAQTNELSVAAGRMTEAFNDLNRATFGGTIVGTLAAGANVAAESFDEAAKNTNAFKTAYKELVELRDKFVTKGGIKASFLRGAKKQLFDDLPDKQKLLITIPAGAAKITGTFIGEMFVKTVQQELPGLSTLLKVSPTVVSSLGTPNEKNIAPGLGTLSHRAGLIPAGLLPQPAASGESIPEQKAQLKADFKDELPWTLVEEVMEQWRKDAIEAKAEARRIREQGFPSMGGPVATPALELERAERARKKADPSILSPAELRKQIKDNEEASGAADEARKKALQMQGEIAGGFGSMLGNILSDTERFKANMVASFANMFLQIAAQQIGGPFGSFLAAIGINGNSATTGGNELLTGGPDKQGKTNSNFGVPRRGQGGR